MAARVFNSLGRVGLGIAVLGGVVNTALYNGNPAFLIMVKKCICNI